jgi:hypothetical protein
VNLDFGFNSESATQLQSIAFEDCHVHAEHVKVNPR